MALRERTQAWHDGLRDGPFRALFSDRGEAGTVTYGCLNGALCSAATPPCGLPAGGPNVYCPENNAPCERLPGQPGRGRGARMGALWAVLVTLLREGAAVSRPGRAACLHRSRPAAALLPSRRLPCWVSRARPGVGLLDHAGRDVAVLGARPAVLARLPGAGLRRGPAVAAPRPAGAGAVCGRSLVGRWPAGGRPRRCAWSGTYFHFVWLDADLAAAVPGRRWCCWPAAGRAGAGRGRRSLFLVFMIPLPLPRRDRAGRPAAAARHRRQHLPAADARPAGPGRGQRHPARRHRDRHRRGVQRPADAGDLLRPVDGRGPGHPPAAVGDGCSSSPAPCRSPWSSNVIRITATGVLHETGRAARWPNAVFHDLAGWLMMPLALGHAVAGAADLTHLWLEPRPRSPVASPWCAARRRARWPPRTSRPAWLRGMTNCLQ